MGEYLHFANDMVQKLEPVIERRTGTRLENMLVEDSSAYAGSDSDKLRNAYMFVNGAYPNTIFMNERRYDKEEDPFGAIPRGVTHELAHLAHRKLIEKVRETDIRADMSRLVKRYRKSRVFREGFAEYLSLDHLRDIYEYQTFKKVARDIRLVSSYYNSPDALRPYEQGYKFFKKVLSVIGKDKVFDIARSPPLYEAEVRMPLLYLLRRYPAKGIKNIPKFLIRNIKTKIYKKKHGYAPFDF
jgi:hypothetical protein